jgi:phosphate transport system substrate-binding protein
MKKHLLLILALAASVSAPADIKITGSSSVGVLITKKQVTIEAASGQKILVVNKNAGLGLQELCSGKTDLSMTIGPISLIAAGANADLPGSVDLGQVHSTLVGRENVAFVVHPSNPVKSITLEQLQKIYSGTVKNWKDLGGIDAEIKAYAASPANGTRLAFDQIVMKGVSISAAVVVRATTKDITPIIAQLPSAIGFVPAPNAGAGITALSTDRPVPMDIAINSKVDPSPAQKAVIDAIQSALK